jgi:hypothetical protein
MDRIRPLAARYLEALWIALRSDAAIYAVAAIYIVIGYVFMAGKGYLAFGMLNVYYGAWSMHFGVLGPVFVTIIGLLHIVIRLDARRRLAYRAMFAPRRVARFVAGTILLLTAVLLFTTMFSAIKTSFPIDHGFRFDVAQADIDKAIHFGVDPWRLLYAVAEHPLVLRIVEMNYNVIWFIICYFTLYWVCTSPRTNGMRVRYVLTWLLSWALIGTVMAGTWLSAGPAYYGLVTGDTARFADQLAFLSTTAGERNSAQAFQSYLWYLYSSGNVGIGSGISAFPSVHVAVTTINALFIGEISRRFSVLMWAYVVFIIMSSVYLGWHYAIDGYVSVVTVTAIYWALRKLIPTLARLRWKARAERPTEVFARNS